MTRTRLLGIILASALIAIASVVLIVRSSGRPAQADTPHFGLNFAIGIDVDGDSRNDCGTGAPSVVGDGAPDAVPIEVTTTTCRAAADAKLAVSVYLMDNGGIAYFLAASHVYYSGVVSNGRGTSVWACHTWDVTAPANPAYENASSAIGVAAPCDVLQTNVGLMNTFSFSCTYGGVIALGPGPGETLLADANVTEHREAGTDALSIICGSRPTATPYPTPAPPPSATLNFAIGVDVDGDGANDCGTGVPHGAGDGAPDSVPVEVTNTTCAAEADAKLDVRVYLMDNGGIAYAANTSHVYYAGVTSSGRGTSVWRCHVFDYAADGATFENAGSAIGIAAPCNVAQTNLGLMNTFSFTCTDGGTISLGHAPGETMLTSGDMTEYREAGPDMLTVDCQEGLPTLAGDSDCNGSVNSIDATLILQYGAGLIPMLPCNSAADVNRDGVVDSRDAALDLQFTAGLLTHL